MLQQATLKLHLRNLWFDLDLTYTSPLFEKALKESGLEAEEQERIIQAVMQEGSCQDIANVPEDIQNTFVVSADISAEEHVRMQAALQAYVDNSISKTINFPPAAAPPDVAQAYKLAWELGCKGITVYVTGSREKVVLETQSSPEQEQPREGSLIHDWKPTKKPRPRHLQGYTYSIDTPLGKAFVTINENGGHQPFEVFINTAKAGSDTAAVSEAIGRSLSYILRMSSPIPPRDRLDEMIRQYHGIGGRRPLGFGPNRVRSLPDGVAKALQEYLDSTGIQNPDQNHVAETEPFSRDPRMKIGDLCPDCGQAALVNEEGCRKCYACGFSEC